MKPPIKHKQTIQYPACIAMYLKPLRSKSALMATIGNANLMPQHLLRLQPDVAASRKIQIDGLQLQIIRRQ